MRIRQSFFHLWLMALVQISIINIIIIKFISIWYQYQYNFQNQYNFQYQYILHIDININIFSRIFCCPYIIMRLYKFTCCSICPSGWEQNLLVVAEKLRRVCDVINTDWGRFSAEGGRVAKSSLIHRWPADRVARNNIEQKRDRSHCFTSVLHH